MHSNSMADIEERRDIAADLIISPDCNVQVAKSPLDGITDTLLYDDMMQFKREVEVLLEAQTPYLTDTERNMFLRGKKIRPVVMMLCARMIAEDDPLPRKLYRGAASLETLHIATLIHDDIVDEAPLRRGLPSVSAARGTKTALLIGDLHFVQALRSFADVIDTERDMMLIKLVLNTAFDICRGELDELERTPQKSHIEYVTRYYQTIDRKTAALFRLACQAGIDLVGGRTRDARRAGFFGRSLGRAFQIMDDVIDVLAVQGSEGKQPGIDLELGRMSLPLLYGTEILGPDHVISKALYEGIAPQGEILAEALDDLRECGAIDRAYAQARREMLQALFYLQPFPANRYREALDHLARFVVDRPLQTEPEKDVPWPLS